MYNVKMMRPCIGRNPKSYIVKVKSLSAVAAMLESDIFRKFGGQVIGVEGLTKKEKDILYFKLLSMEKTIERSPEDKNRVFNYIRYMYRRMLFM